MKTASVKERGDWLSKGFERLSAKWPKLSHAFVAENAPEAYRPLWEATNQLANDGWQAVTALNLFGTDSSVSFADKLPWLSVFLWPKDDTEDAGFNMQKAADEFLLLAHSAGERFGLSCGDGVAIAASQGNASRDMTVKSHQSGPTAAAMGWLKELYLRFPPNESSFVAGRGKNQIVIHFKRLRMNLLDGSLTLIEMLSATTVARAKPGKGGRIASTLDIAEFAHTRRSKNPPMSWAKIFEDWKFRYPKDARVKKEEQLRDAHRRHFGDKSGDAQ